MCLTCPLIAQICFFLMMQEIDRIDQGGTRPSLFHLSKRSEKVEKWNNDWLSAPAICSVFIIHQAKPNDSQIRHLNR